MLKYLTPFFLSALLSFLLTPPIRLFAFKIKALDYPNERKIHNDPMPRAGGLAIFLSFIMAIGLAMLGGVGSTYFKFLLEESQWLWVLAGGLVIVGMGLLDDIWKLHYGVKFLIQLLAASLLIYSGFTVKAFSLPFSDRTISLGFLTLPFTILWIVGIMNALNLIDGLDGLAAGVAFISSLAIFAISFYTHNIPGAFISCVLAGSILGFLRYNFNPASIFLGDCGSLFLGYVLSILSIQGGFQGPVTLSILIPFLALGLPILDTLLAILRRLLKNTKMVQSNGTTLTVMGIFKADRAHIHHRLLDMGLTQRRAVLTLYGVCLFLGAGALASVFLRGKSIGLLLLSFGLATFFGLRKLGYKELEILKSGRLLPIFSLPLVNRSLFHVFFDMFIIGLAYGGAFILRFETFDLGPHKEMILETFPLLLAVKIILFFLYGVYRRSYLMTNVDDFLRIFQAVFVSSWVALLFNFFIFDYSISFSIYVIDFLLLLLLLAGSRSSLRVLSYLHRSGSKSGQKTIIYGAGLGGTFALREFRNNPDLKINPIGFIDDRPALKGKLVHGLPVFGSLEELSRIIGNPGPSQIVISFKKISPKKLNTLKTFCQEKGIILRRFHIGIEDLTKG